MNPEDVVVLVLVRSGVDSDLLFAQANVNSGELEPVVGRLVQSGLLKASGPAGARQYSVTAPGGGQQELERAAGMLAQKWDEIVGAMEKGEKDRFAALVQENEKWIGVMAFTGMISEDDARAVFDAANRILRGDNDDNNKKDDDGAGDLFSDMLQTHLGSYVKYD